VIDLGAKTGSVRANDAAIVALAEESTHADQDTSGLTLDPGDDTVYLLDREDDDDIIKITAAGAVSELTGVTAATIGNSGIVFADTGIGYPANSLIYVNTDTDDVVKYNLLGGSESTLVSKASWIAVTGGTQNGIAGGPVPYGESILIFDEAGFSGSDTIVQTNVKTGATSIYTAKSVFGTGTEPGFSTMVVTSDGTIIGWDEFGATTAAFTFIIIPNGTGTPIRIPRSTIETALSLTAGDVDPTDENSMLVWVDTADSVEVLFGVSGPTTGGCVGKMTFSKDITAVRDWNLY
jgi:hypothetical protein